MSATTRLGIKDVAAARECTHGIADNTPLNSSPWISTETGSPFLMMLELIQAIGA